MKIKRYVSVLLLIIITFTPFIAVEFGYRFYKRYVPRETGGDYRELAQLQGWTSHQINKHIDSCSTFSNMYRDYYLFSLEPKNVGDINITEYFSARSTPDSVHIGEATSIIWMFGGSTMQNFETNDKLSIANTIAIAANKKEKVAVLNFGTGSFHSITESIKFFDLLRRINPIEYPKIAIFYDGYNDAEHSYLYGPGNLNGNWTKPISYIVKGNYDKLFALSANIMLSEYIKVYKSIQIHLDTILKKETSSNLKYYSDPGQSVSVYLTNRKQIEAVCNSFNVRCLFVLQPLLVTKSPLHPFEEKVLSRQMPGLVQFTRDFYSMVLANSRNNKNFVDLSQILNNETTPHFYDFGHTGPLTGKIIGEAISASLSVSE
ncbi:MAG: hypothetical protein HQL77_10480 [Magnetococcales bacterium]|nr:hypothetical protein [Magnetococcales bacterium]